MTHSASLSPPHSSCVQTLRILIVRLSAHGDVVQTLPFLGLLRQQFPNAHIGWVVEAQAAPLLDGHPDIQKIHISHRKSWLRQLKTNPLSLARVLREAWQFFDGIRRERYALSVDVQGLFKSAIIPFLAGIPKRLGYQDTREMGSLFYTEKLTPHNLTDPHLPTAVKFSEALGFLSDYQPLNHVEALRQSIPYPIPPISTSAKASVEVLLRDRQLNFPTIALAPGTMWPSKQWPKSNWQQLITSLLQEAVNVVMIGSPEDRLQFEDLMPSESSSKGVYINLMGNTQLEELYALFQQVDIFVGPDSAPLHMANAVSCNTLDHRPHLVALFGPTGPKRTGPVGPAPHQTLHIQLPCQPCFKRHCPIPAHQIEHMACQNQLSPEHVFAAIQHQRAVLEGQPV